MKKCSKCNKILPDQDFNWRKKGVKRSSYCKDCSRKLVRSHYQRNRAYYLHKALKQNRANREEIFSYIIEYLKDHHCVDCGEDNILVLEFDHEDRSDKVMEINNLIKKRASLSKLKLEVAKCSVRCANCHRIKTQIESNSWKVRYLRP